MVCIRCESDTNSARRSPIDASAPAWFPLYTTLPPGLPHYRHEGLFWGAISLSPGVLLIAHRLTRYSGASRSDYGCLKRETV